MTLRRPGLATLFALVAACSRPPADANGDGAVPVDSLLARGERVYLRGAYDTARTLWTEALDRSRLDSDTLAEARALTWLGLAAWRQGDYQAARTLGEQALALKRGLARGADLFKSYNALGLLAWNEGRLADATELLGRASAAARAADDAGGIAAASGNLALVQVELGEFEEARRGFDSMRVAGRAIRDARIEGNALTNLGMLAIRVGDPVLAVPLLDSARAHYRIADYPAGEQNALGQLGTAFAALGRPSQALAVLDSALDFSRRQGLRQDEASNLEAIAALYRDLGDHQRALDLYALAEPINRELDLTVEAGADLRHVAEIHAVLGALGAAREAAARALATHRAAESRAEQLSDLLLLADLAHRSGTGGEAERLLAEARALANALGARSAIAEVAVAAARIADRAGRPRAVLTALGDAQGALDAGGYELEQEGLRLEARALARLGRLDSAAVIGRRAVAALERVRGSLRSGELRTSYLAGRQGAYADLADVLRRLGRTEEAFEVSDAARGRALVDGLASARRGTGLAGTPGRVLRRGDEVLRTVAALREQLRAVEAEVGGSADSSRGERLRFLERRLDEARREYEELAIRLKELGSPAAASLGAAQPPTRTILDALDPDEAMLEYLAVGDSMLIFVARRSGLSVVAVPLPQGGLEPRVRLARELIAGRGDTTGRARPALRGLGDLLVAPVRRSGTLRGIRSLIVVPHGVLAYLPFAALVDGETGRYLVEEYAILTLPSAGSLAVLRGRSVSPRGATASEIFAPDPAALPATRTEAEAVARMLPRAALRVGRRASESALREALASGALVHLASHGELNPRNPMFSFLQTAASRGVGSAGDGRLEIHEILGLRVTSPLVFLSGCETGLGRGGSTGFAVGEDFATLSRAFLHAGARNVVATLWRVDDGGAAAFAREYYRRLAAEGPVAALSGAQRAMAGGGRYAAPYYWAGYTLAGDGRRAAAAMSVRVSVTR